jgi:hypothetical protein
VRRYHFRVPDGTPGFMLVEGEVKAVGNFKADDRPGEMGVVLYNMGDRGGKNGELDHFAYRASDGTCVVRFTPPGARLFTAADVARQGDYFAEFPRRLGAPAIFPLTEVSYHLYGGPNLFGTNFGVPVPGGEAKAGTTWKYRFLFSVFLSEPGELNEPAERIRKAFGLAGDVAYSPQLVKGEIKDKVYWLRLQALDGGAAVNVEKTDLPGGLPIAVDGLNERWSAVVADRKTGKFVNFIGVLDGTGYGLVDIRKEPLSLFVGHPVRCGDPNLFIQLLSWGKDGASAEVNNPTDQPVKTWVECSPDCEFLKPGRIEADIPAGQSVVVKF